jgi:ribosome-associated translation inhibitor RaiA
MDSKEAEIKAREYIGKKYSRLERVFFSNMYKDGNIWMLNGEVEFKRAYFFTQMRIIEVQVNMNTGEIMSHKERRSP